MSAAEFTVENCLRFLAENGYSTPNTHARKIVSLAAEQPSQNTLCDGLAGVYSNGIHIGAIFLILGVSFLGTAIPVASKFIPALGRYPFIFTVAKTAATGVLLSVSTIHLLHEGAMAFREECMNETLKLYEPAYFLFALVAVLLMQLLDIQLEEIAERWMKAQEAKNKLTNETDEVAQLANTEQVPVQRENDVEVALNGAPDAALDPDNIECEAVVPSASGTAEEPTASSRPTATAAAEEPTCQYPFPHEKCEHLKAEDCDAHGHQHLTVSPPRDMGSIRRVISAVCMEFGVTLHSVFVGLAIGLTTDAELKPLLVALVFHQLFEGMAMGSRLADAEFKGSLEIILALVFSVSAPVGMAAATIAVSVSRDAMSGTGFVTLMGVLDSLCGGILMYLAFTLLLGDFVADLKHSCAEGQPYRLWKKIALFAALWIGMGLMALVGNWL